MQFFLLRKRLGDFNLCGLLLLFQRIQCGISIGNAVGKIADGIVQTDDVAARVIAQRYRITQLAAENDLMLILETVKANVQLKAAIGAAASYPHSASPCRRASAAHQLLFSHRTPCP